MTPDQGFRPEISAVENFPPYVRQTAAALEVQGWTSDLSADGTKISLLEPSTDQRYGFVLQFANDTYDQGKGTTVTFTDRMPKENVTIALSRSHSLVIKDVRKITMEGADVALHTERIKDGPWTVRHSLHFNTTTGEVDYTRQSKLQLR